MVSQSLARSGCQVAKQMRPPGPRAWATFANAAMGSEKNIVPNRLMARSEPPGRSSVWTSASTNSTLASPAAAQRRRATSSIGPDRSMPCAVPWGPRVRAAARVVAAAPAADVEDTLSGLGIGGSEDGRGDGLEDAVPAVGVRRPAVAAVAVPGLLLGLVAGGHLSVRFLRPGTSWSRRWPRV